MLNKVGAKKQPCFNPTLSLKESNAMSPDTTHVDMKMCCGTADFTKAIYKQLSRRDVAEKYWQELHLTPAGSNGSFHNQLCPLFARRP